MPSRYKNRLKEWSLLVSIGLGWLGPNHEAIDCSLCESFSDTDGSNNCVLMGLGQHRHVIQLSGP